MSMTDTSTNPLITRSVQLMRRLQDDTVKDQIPKPDDAFVWLLNRLVENHFRVLVTGEAKRGKSTFWNGLTGMKWLPDDVDIATCSLFYLQHAETPQFFAVYDDGRRVEITHDEVLRLGSQVVVEAEGQLRRPANLVRIELFVPMAWLPRNISGIDSPGLGSAHSWHAAVTESALPETDAVVYVLDSTSGPISDLDQEWIARLLKHTPHLFFVQTKIDRTYEANWTKTLKQNESHLKRLFGEQLGEPRVWPVSSTQLLNAAQRTDAESARRERELKASRYPRCNRRCKHSYMGRLVGGAVAKRCNTSSKSSPTASGSWMSVTNRPLVRATTIANS